MDGWRGELQTEREGRVLVVFARLHREKIQRVNICRRSSSCSRKEVSPLLIMSSHLIVHSALTNKPKICQLTNNFQCKVGHFEFPTLLAC